MDDKPFLTINITELSEADIENLRKFRKEAFNTEELMYFAEEMIYTSNLKAKLKEIFNEPPDEFIRYLIKDFRDTRITSNVIERFRPIVKKSISKAILDIVSQGLFKEEESSREAAAAATEDQAHEVHESSSAEEPTEKPKREIITTEEELQCFEIIKEILREAGRDVSEVNCKDTTAYFAIYNRNILNWFLRVNLDSSKRNIITKLPIEKAEKLANNRQVEPAPKGHGESRIYIESIEDLKDLNQLIMECFDGTVS